MRYTLLSILTLVLPILSTQSLACDKPIHSGAYAEAGILYNTDAYGITTPWTGHVQAGYELPFPYVEQLVIDIFARHESDILRDGIEDLISNASSGITARYRF